MFQLWSVRRVNRIIFIIWSLTILECVPLIYPFEVHWASETIDSMWFQGTHYDFISPIRSIGVGLGVAGNLANMIYQARLSALKHLRILWCQVIAMLVGGLLELIAIAFYVFIGLRMSRLKVVSVILPETNFTRSEYFELYHHCDSLRCMRLHR